MFEKRIQLSILLENKPGRFGEVCEMLYEIGVDIHALSTTPIGESGILRMVVDNPESAVAGLQEAGMPFHKTDVLVAQVPNKAGMAAGLGHRFSQAGINIEYTYFSGGEKGSLSLLVFKVPDVDQALNRLIQDAYN